MFSALLTGSLHDFTLIICSVEVESAEDRIQSDNWKCRPVLREPGVLPGAGESRHECDCAPVLLMWHVMQTAEPFSIEQKASMIIGERIRTAKAAVLLGHQFS
jgi:hypothetical protein